jgi:hypothetical protein
MPKVAVEFGFKQIETLARQLKQEDQLRLAKELIGFRMDTIVSKIRQSIRRKKLSQKDISNIVKEVRQKRYA